ncbi:vitelline membrane outer layer protein 1-like isoform X1 [Mytilus edulis]|uniref:vitelline membrane outer layer protein 1-like isoform X1 n=2 Tax=Mytilus edulis TaxID=6550 RepID=UPI0039EE8703
MEILYSFILCYVFHSSYAFLNLPDVPRQHIKTIGVSNGGWWGDWHPPHFCADGFFATGYNMKIEGNQHGHDDTSLNAILLRCMGFDNHYGGTIESGEGSYGDWIGWTDCEKFGVHKNQTYLTSFSLQVEGDQGGGDDTAANYIKFKCRDFDDDRDESELAHPPGHGLFGGYGGWSESCPTHSAICGIQTRIEGPQGGGIHGDDTSLNNVKFFCCDK